MSALSVAVESGTTDSEEILKPFILNVLGYFQPDS